VNSTEHSTHEARSIQRDLLLLDGAVRLPASGLQQTASSTAPIRSAAPRVTQVIPGVTKMRLDDHNQLSSQIQKILQAILLREAFSLFALQGVAVRHSAPTVILDVSCGPGDYSVAWTSQIARFLPKGIAFYCTDYPGDISKVSGETYAMATAKKVQAAAVNGKLKLAQVPVPTDADLFSGHDALMPVGKTT
jgi:hypothetical protein